VSAYSAMSAWPRTAAHERTLREVREGPQHEVALAIVRFRLQNTVFHQQTQNFSAGLRLTGRIPMAEPISHMIMQIRTVGCPFE
jgi:hypothetical protein